MSLKARLFQREVLPFVASFALLAVHALALDGLEAARRIRAGGRGDLPIIAMTASAFSEERQACLDAGMNHHVSKPVDPQGGSMQCLRVG